jgi:DNA-binding winged helix-turn-helix (wHTH) protein/tetratricopeptide (TPR) repeat protein
MNVLDRTLPWLPRIDLARETDFRLGGLKVRPSRREVEAGEIRQVLQPRVMQVLVALAHPSSDVVSQDELIGRCWNGLAVGEDAVARCISQLRRVAAAWPEPPFQIETIPGVGYRMTPVATGDTPAAASRPLWRSPRAWIAIGLVSVAVSAAILAFHPWRTGRAGPPAPNPTIAILGFQPAGAGAREKDLAAALPQRVADALSRYNITVIAGSGAGADFTVEGRVADRDGRLHVTADLSDPHSHVLVYSFDTPVPDDPRGDVASEVAGHVALSLDPSKLSSTLGGKLTAADYVLIARITEAIDRPDWLACLDQLRKLAVRHPEDGELQASLAVPAIYAAEQEAPPDQRPRLVQIAHESVGRAERLNPNSAILYYAKALLVNGPLSYPEQERRARKSLNLNPDYHVAYNQLGELMLMVGRTEEGVGLVKRSVQLDPMSIIVVSSATRDLFWAGRLEESSQNLARQEQIWPDYRFTPLGKYSVAYYSGDAQQVLALDSRYHLSEQAGAPRALMVEAARTHDPASAQRLADDCLGEFGRSVWKDEDPVCLVAMVRLGRLDDAFRLAALAYPDYRGFAPPDADAWILQPPLKTYPPQKFPPAWLFSPAMKPFRDDPRFWDVAVRTGLVNYWQTTGLWPDFCQPQLDSCKRLAAAAANARPAPPMRG